MPPIGTKGGHRDKSRADISTLKIFRLAVITMKSLVVLLLLLLHSTCIHALSSSTTSPNQAALSAIKFPHTWVPLASTFELDPQRPNVVEFCSQKYVAYHDGTAWLLLDNACSHRLAPLSEGRVNAKGLLECSYHGWTFCNGTCVRIPQIEDKMPTTNARMNVQSYPVVVEKNVLWAWLWEDTANVLTTTPAYFTAGVWEDSSTYTRDLPYGYDTVCMDDRP